MSIGIPETTRLARWRWEAKARCGEHAWIVAYGKTRRSSRRNLARRLAGRS